MSDDLELEYSVIKALGRVFPLAYTDLGLMVGLQVRLDTIQTTLQHLVEQGLVHHLNALHMYSLTHKGWARFTYDRNSAKLELLTAYA